MSVVGSFVTGKALSLNLAAALVSADLLLLP